MVITSNIHALLHDGKNIRDNGPMYTTWEFSLEGYSGIIAVIATLKVGSSYRRPYSPSIDMDIYRLAGWGHGLMIPCFESSGLVLICHNKLSVLIHPRPVLRKA